MEREIVCPLCGRTMPAKTYLEKHHLVPRSKGGTETESICVDCGNQVHELFSNNELRDVYNTIGALKRDERVWRWIKWVRKQKNFGICMKRKKRKF